MLPSDLIRNYLFMRVSMDAAGAVDALYDNYWRPFDDRRVKSAVNGEDRFWHIEERQGRLTRPRIDLFLFHYLVMQTETDFTIGSLFREFRDWRDRQSGSVERLLIDLQRYSQIFADMIEPSGDDRASLLAQRLKALDTSTVYPFLLYILALPAERLPSHDRERLLIDLESWLVRRFIGQLTNKNYNRFFVSLLAKVKRAAPEVSLADVVRGELSRANDATTAWPSDQSFRTAWLTKPVYAKSRPDRSGMVLRAIEAQIRTSRNEAVTLPEKLTVEHLLPQRGTLSDYPLACDGLTIDDEAPAQCRERLLHTIGNLTLLTTELNASASNGPFPGKVEKIVADSDLRLNAWLRVQPPTSWSEQSILDRGDRLFATAMQIWPRPPSDVGEIEAAASTETERAVWKFTDQPSLNAKRASLLAALAAQLGAHFVPDTVGKHRSTDGRTRVTITISKRYEDRGGYPYWYAFHPDWQDYLASAENGYLLLGMMDRTEGYALPLAVLLPLLPLLNTTTRADTGKLHWHLHVIEEPSGPALLLPKADKSLPIGSYAIPATDNEIPSGLERPASGIADTASA